ncbi:MAG: hypothetical protein HFH89_04135 [Lachnospiraceae bacterium]|nr:hypothetical protein [uncultured Acetatifactor sp.]MCI8286844.1 hypothetical protein [Lachnospiraceae bacterium]
MLAVVEMRLGRQAPKKNHICVEPTDTIRGINTRWSTAGGNGLREKRRVE